MRFPPTFSTLVVALSLGALCGTAAPPAHAVTAAKPKVIEVSKAKVRPYLRRGERIDHAVFQAPLGPSRKSMLVLVSLERDGSGTDFGAFVVADGRRIPLQLPDEDWEHTGFPAVMLKDLDGDGVVEPIIMRTFMTGMGPGGAEDQNSNFIVDWDGQKFVLLDELSSHISEYTSARKISKALKKLKRLIDRTAKKVRGR